MPPHLLPRKRRSQRRLAPWIAIVIASVGAVVGVPDGGRGQEPSPAVASESDVSSNIRAGVQALGYADEVGDRFVRLVAPWKPADWKRRIEQSRRRQADGKDTASDVSQVQSRVLDEIRRRLAGAFEQADGKSDKYHLDRVLESRQSQCLGNCQLLFVLGGAVGLDVRPLDVILPSKGTLGEHMFHEASIVRLADGRVRMVDERWDIDSKPFLFTEHYEPEGIHWRLIDGENPLGVHRMVRVRDLRGLKADLWTCIAYSRMRASRLEEARDFLARALDHDPESTFTLLALTRIAVSDGKSEEVDSLLARSLQLDPERAEVHSLRASLAADKGRLEEALTSYDSAIRLLPESPDALCERGFVHRDLGALEKAIADLTESLRMRPQHGLALLARGSVYAQRGEHGLALADLDAAVAADSSDAIAYLQRGLVKIALGQREKALPDLDKACERRPDDPRVWLNRGVCRLQLGKPGESLADFAKVLELSPGDSEALGNRACALVDLGRPSEALADCDRVLSIAPEHDFALFNRGVALAHLGRKVEARRSIDASVTSDPESRRRAEAAIQRFGL